jgi:hypothetical protein
MFCGALDAVGCLAAKIAIQLGACSICHKLGHVEMGEKLLAAAVCGWVVDLIEEAGRGSVLWFGAMTYLAMRLSIWSLTYT